MAGATEREWDKAGSNSHKNKSTWFHNYDEVSPFGAARKGLGGGEHSHKSKRKNNKSQSGYTGKGHDDKRSRNVGFESYVTHYNQKKGSSKTF